MKKDFVIYRGWSMHKDHPAKIEEAQTYPYYKIGNSKYERIRYGDEEHKWKKEVCHDCAAERGEFHTTSCDV